MHEEENDAVHVEKFYCAKLVIESIIYQIERKYSSSISRIRAKKDVKERQKQRLLLGRRKSWPRTRRTGLRWPYAKKREKKDEFLYY